MQDRIHALEDQVESLRRELREARAEISILRRAREHSFLLRSRR